MNKYIAVSLAVLILIGGLLFGINGSEGGRSISETFSRPLSLSLPDLSFKLPAPIINQPEEARAAWEVFEAYREAAKDHDLVELRTLSYQISPTCSTPAREAECFALMDSVYAIAQDWKEEDFTKTYFDGRQIVLISEKEPLGVMLLFTRDSAGIPKVLGIKWCLPDQNTGKVDNCFETDPNKRDLDKDGWWDEVEALFYK